MFPNFRSFTVRMDTNIAVTDPAVYSGPFPMGGAKTLVIQPVSVSGANASHVVTLYGSNVWGQDNPVALSSIAALNLATIGTIDQLTLSVYELSVTPSIGLAHLVMVLTTAEGEASVTDFHVSMVY